MPCGVTMRPLPKLASTSPVFRSNLKIGSTGLESHVMGAPAPNVPAPQRSYAQMWPSIGSMSIPAVEPHSRPSGNVPQFAVTVGAGFGSLSPVIGLPTGIAGASGIACGASDSEVQPASRNTVQTNNMARKNDMAAPFATATYSIDSNQYRMTSACLAFTVGSIVPPAEQLPSTCIVFLEPGDNRARNPLMTSLEDGDTSESCGPS